MGILRGTCLDVMLMSGALLLSGAVAVSGAFSPFVAGAGTPVLVLAAPWGVGAAHIAEQGGGAVIGPSQTVFGALATFDDPDPRARLKRLGAWAVRDGQFLAMFCKGGTV
ncbi:hypothetical protein [Pacificoceanicola onchidii]|uniref:hypothetical protein n=1 Tax=Pacificoceanicola onchidii TaxID=2562685 RepID=UPI0010A660E5|nr:hypothetical protein [Pacificoceanicola onchidii]